MVNFPGRNGRRRRVLNEEVLSASSSHVALRAAADDNVRNAPRYSDAAGVENHPQVTDFVPRQYRTIALLVLIGVALVAALGTLDYFAAGIASATGMPSSAGFEITAPGSIAAWVGSIVLLIAAAMCTLVYSIRRHRVDDYRGRYRVWLAAAAACLVLSVDAVAGLHRLLASVLSHVTSWTALRDGAIWWLTLAGLPMAWIFTRTLLDAKECRLAVSLLVTSVAAYAASGTAYFGALSTFGPQIESTVAGTAMLLGHWMLFAAVVAYARFVVLDAQGLVSVRPRVKYPRKTRAKSAVPSSSQRDDPTGPSTSLLSAGGYSRQRPAHDLTPAKPVIPGQWVDGSRPERDPYDDEGDEGDDAPSEGRKLSKADRKRLRKLKAQNRAA